jgi:hypothetical protein
MSRIQKLKIANVKDDTTIRLTFRDGGSVIHCHDGLKRESSRNFYHQLFK